MLNRLVGLWLLLFVSTTTSFAQYKFSSDPATFVTEVNEMMVKSKNTVAIEAGSRFGTTLSSFSADQQKAIIETVQKLGKSKKVRSHPNFTHFFNALSAAKASNISNNNLDSLLIITNKLTDDYESKVVQKFMLFINDFFGEGILYGSNYNRLRVSGGSYSFLMAENKTAIEEMIEEVEEVEEVPKEEDYFSDWDTPPSDDEYLDYDYDNTSSNEDVLDVGYIYPEQPRIDGPVLELRNVDLAFATAKDSSVIKNTNGSLRLTDFVFVGKGGTMDWSSAGVPAGEIQAELREYNFPVNVIRVLSEGAILSYKSRADSLIEGIFEYKENKSVENAQYPRFKSYKSNIDLKIYDENIIYRGGLSLAGKNIYSSSIDEGLSSIEILKEGVTKIKAFSNRFEFSDSLIVANFATLSLYIDSDSITHPGTHFKYNKNTSLLRISKKEGYNYAPFVDSYHRLEIISDVIVWDLNKIEIDFNIINAKNHVPATFESDEFFHADKFFRLKGAYRFHPLQVIVTYSDINKVQEFNAIDVCTPLNIPIETFKGAMVNLMKMGYINYNIKSGLIKLRPKARHYTLSSRNKKDYDNISFISLSPGAVNATLNLENHELFVRGVDRIYISDSLRVNFAPTNKEIRIQKNRNFKFDGIINTENFQFIGTDFEFVYDTFLVHLHNIDEIKLAVVKKKKGAKVDSTATNSRVLGNELRYSSGTLYINKPNNKSARINIPQYPIFDATSGATVYFDKKNINGGVYDTSVQFQIPPFRLDSLSSDDPHTIGFDGTFKSGGIFPEFKEKLVVMPDYSLGFVHKVPKGGYPLYEGDGKYYNRISLDQKGVRGDGEIKYLTTTLYSNMFIFYSDSMKTEGTLVEMKEGIHKDAKVGVTYPEMFVKNYRAVWYPKLDSMFISNVKEPLAYYDSTATMIGTSNLTKEGLFGRGVLFTRGSVSESYHFTFEKTDFEARNALFKIESDDPDKPALLGNNVKLLFDLDSAVAHFSPEVEGFASNSFPYVQYKSALQEGRWDLKDKMVILEMPDSADISKSYFYSTKPDQDSLVYNATKGVYDIEKQILNISGIPFINVADARIYPDSGKVRVRQNADIKILKKAILEIDTLNKYHHLYDGEIEILSRTKFQGTATYRYINLGDDTLAIQFQEFNFQPGTKRKASMHTVSTGLVNPEDSLTVGPKIIYKGKVTMYAESPYLVFDGSIKLVLNGALSYSDWIKYSNSGEDKSVKINLQDAVSENGKPLTTGLHLNGKSNQIYTSFISTKENFDDQDFFIADKAFDYDLDSSMFLIGDTAKFSRQTYKGNNMAYNDSTSIIRYSGRFNFLKIYEKNNPITLISTGDGYADLNKSDYNFNTLLSFNMPLNGKITASIATKLNELDQPVEEEFTEDPLPEELLEVEEEEENTPKKETPVNEENKLGISEEVPAPEKEDNKLYNKIANIVGQKGLDSYIAKNAVIHVPLNNIDKNLGKGMTFSNVDLKWSEEYKAFYSIGKLKIAGFQKIEVNKLVDGYIEIRKTKDGDVVTIYLEPKPNEWYFITYDNNRLSSISSVDEINQIIRGKSKGEMPDRSKLFFVAAEAMEKQKFINGFKTRYLDFSADDLMNEKVLKTKDSTSSVVDSTKQIVKEEVIQEEEIDTDPDPDVKSSKSNKKKKAKNYDQYKLPDQEEDTNTQEEEPKEKPTIEDQQKKQQDQQKMKDLFK